MLLERVRHLVDLDNDWDEGTWTVLWSTEQEVILSGLRETMRDAKVAAYRLLLEAEVKAEEAGAIERLDDSVKADLSTLDTVSTGKPLPDDLDRRIDAAVSRYSGRLSCAGCEAELEEHDEGHIKFTTTYHHFPSFLNPNFHICDATPTPKLQWERMVVVRKLLEIADLPDSRQTSRLIGGFEGEFTCSLCWNKTGGSGMSFDQTVRSPLSP